MGVTSFSIGILSGLIQGRNIKSVVELGAQNRYEDGKLPAPYMKEWYEAKRIDYTSIDLNGEAGAFVVDLSLPFHWESGYGTELPTEGYRGIFLKPVDMVTDFGTSEHISAGNIFDWEKIYNCWGNKHNLCKNGGIIFSENPKTGNWPGHGAYFYTKEFYVALSSLADYTIISLGDHPAMGNYNDGWEIYCILVKNSDRFPTLEEFKTLDLRAQ